MASQVAVLKPGQVSEYLVKNKAATFENMSSYFNQPVDFIRGMILGNPVFSYAKEVGFAAVKGLGKELCFGCGDENWHIYTPKLLGRKYHDRCVEKLFLDRKPSEVIGIKVKDFK